MPEPKLGLLLLGSKDTSVSEIADGLSKFKPISSGEVALLGLDSDDEEWNAAVKEHSITSTPACVLMNIEGKVLAKHEGKIDVKVVARLLKSAEKKPGKSNR